MASETYTTAEVARLFAQPTWRIRRIFEAGDLPEPERFGGRRVIRAELLSQIAYRLRARGWIRNEEVQHA